MPDTFELSVLDATFIVSRLEAASPVPAWALEAPGLVSICRTGDELSILCAAGLDPAAPDSAPRWREGHIHILDTGRDEFCDIRSSLQNPTAAGRLRLHRPDRCCSTRRKSIRLRESKNQIEIPLNRR